MIGKEIMTEKERINIGASLVALLNPILDLNSNPELIANTAIEFCKCFLKDYPELKDVVDSMIENYDSEDPDFDYKWNRQISWIKFSKNSK